MYKKIKQHTNSHELYVQKLLGEGTGTGSDGGRRRNSGGHSPLLPCSFPLPRYVSSYAGKCCRRPKP